MFSKPSGIFWICFFPYGSGRPFLMRISADSDPKHYLPHNLITKPYSTVHLPCPVGCCMTGKNDGISASRTSSSSLRNSSASRKWFTVTRVLWADRASLLLSLVLARELSRGEKREVVDLDLSPIGFRLGESPMGLFTV